MLEGGKVFVKNASCIFDKSFFAHVLVQIPCMARTLSKYVAFVPGWYFAESGFFST